MKTPQKGSHFFHFIRFMNFGHLLHDINTASEYTKLDIATAGFTNATGFFTDN